ncbi:hypothetical protein GUITHDRAFT_132999 [Guillardia theta CCMP2712]|uniref:Uncharacterized protein n=2 Tax=Guillardia theta TaxID=55529 RepID=L1JY20_GUITC|nr:hypothetical protein GUITHDRAFT_132999 [Guillardia theta CCMP2712]EKX53252.1 hypothetical protein GUITHDRAFT_132999 [Guillardia theta CCMP2712]|eukprot:XP_005840232.1 hypothetical protein GUITHDRAFT_132999 [Guillardia theta CCMP2712]
MTKDAKEISTLQALETALKDRVRMLESSATELKRTRQEIRSSHIRLGAYEESITISQDEMSYLRSCNQNLTDGLQRISRENQELKAENSELQKHYRELFTAADELQSWMQIIDKKQSSATLTKYAMERSILEKDLLRMTHELRDLTVSDLRHGDLKLTREAAHSSYYESNVSAVESIQEAAERIKSYDSRLQENSETIRMLEGQNSQLNLHLNATLDEMNNIGRMNESIVTGIEQSLQQSRLFCNCKLIKFEETKSILFYLSSQLNSIAAQVGEFYHRLRELLEINESTNQEMEGRIKSVEHELSTERSECQALKLKVQALADELSHLADGQGAAVLELETTMVNLHSSARNTALEMEGRIKGVEHELSTERSECQALKLKVQALEDELSHLADGQGAAVLELETTMVNLHSSARNTALEMEGRIKGVEHELSTERSECQALKLKVQALADELSHLADGQGAAVLGLETTMVNLHSSARNTALEMEGRIKGVEHELSTERSECQALKLKVQALEDELSHLADGQGAAVLGLETTLTRACLLVNEALGNLADDKENREVMGKSFKTLSAEIQARDDVIRELQDKNSSLDNEVKRLRSLAPSREIVEDPIPMSRPLETEPSKKIEQMILQIHWMLQNEEDTDYYQGFQDMDTVEILGNILHWLEMTFLGKRQDIRLGSEFGSEVNVALCKIELQLYNIEQSLHLNRDQLESMLLYWTQRLHFAKSSSDKKYNLSCLLTDCFVNMATISKGNHVDEQYASQEFTTASNVLSTSIDLLESSLQKIAAHWYKVNEPAPRSKAVALSISHHQNSNEHSHAEDIGYAMIQKYEDLIQSCDKRVAQIDSVLAPCLEILDRNDDSLKTFELHLNQCQQLCKTLDQTITSTNSICTSDILELSRGYNKLEVLVSGLTDVIPEIEREVARERKTIDSFRQQTVYLPQLQKTNERLEQAVADYQIAEELLGMKIFTLEKKAADDNKEIEYLRSIILEMNQRLRIVEEESKQALLNERCIASRIQQEICEGLRAMSSEMKSILKEMFSQKSACGDLFEDYHVYVEKFFESATKIQLLSATLEEMKSYYSALSQKHHDLQEIASQRQAMCDGEAQTPLEFSDEEFFERLQDFDASCTRALTEIEWSLNEMKLKSTHLEAPVENDENDVSYSLIETELISKERIIEGMHEQLQSLHGSCMVLANERGILEEKLKLLEDENEALLGEIKILTRGQEYFRHDLSMSAEKLQQREQEIHLIQDLERDIAVLQDMVEGSVSRIDSDVDMALRLVRANAREQNGLIQSCTSKLENVKDRMRWSEKELHAQHEQVRCFIHELLDVMETVSDVCHESETYLVTLEQLKNSRSQASNLAETVSLLQSDALAKEKYINHLEQQIQILHQSVIDQKVDTDVAHQHFESKQTEIEVLRDDCRQQRETVIQLRLEKEAAIAMLLETHSAILDFDFPLNALETCMQTLAPSASDCKLNSWPQQANERYRQLVACLAQELDQTSDGLELVFRHVENTLMELQREQSRSLTLSECVRELEAALQEKGDVIDMQAKEIDKLNSKNEMILKEIAGLRSQLQDNDNNYNQNFANMKTQIYKYEAMHLDDVQKLNHSIERINILQEKLAFVSRESESKATNVRNMDSVLASKARSFLDQLQVLERTLIKAQGSVKVMVDSELQSGIVLEALCKASSDVDHVTTSCQERVEEMLVICLHDPQSFYDSMDEILVRLDGCLSKAVAEAHARSSTDLARVKTLEALLSSSEQELRDLHLRHEEARLFMANVQQDVREAEESRIKKDHLIRILEAELCSLQSELESTCKERDSLLQLKEQLQGQLTDKDRETEATSAALEEEKRVRVTLEEYCRAFTLTGDQLTRLEGSSAAVQQVVEQLLQGASRAREQQEELVKARLQLSSKTQVVTLMELELSSQLTRLDQQQEVIRHLESQDRLHRVQLESSWREAMEVGRRLEAAEEMLVPLLKSLLDGIARTTSSCSALRLRVKELEFEYKEEQVLTSTLQRQVEALHDLVLHHQGLSMMTEGSSISHKT